MGVIYHPKQPTSDEAWRIQGLVRGQVMHDLPRIRVALKLCPAGRPHLHLAGVFDDAPVGQCWLDLGSFIASPQTTHVLYSELALFVNLVMGTAFEGVTVVPCPPDADASPQGADAGRTRIRSYPRAAPPTPEEERKIINLFAEGVADTAQEARGDDETVYF